MGKRRTTGALPVSARPSDSSDAHPWIAEHQASISRKSCSRAMASRAESSIILEGRCVSYGSLVPYLPLIDLRSLPDNSVTLTANPEERAALARRFALVAMLFLKETRGKPLEDV